MPLLYDNDDAAEIDKKERTNKHENGGNIMWHDKIADNERQLDGIFNSLSLSLSRR